ncbi:MAG: hypothetical protein K2K15_05600, partial [Anaeroplasmataceae bacterium]|nr:hypothetical protein [Anaeroplasmataceae bacterium]
TEFQLQNLFEKIGTEEDFYLYRKNLWKLLIRNNVGINLQDGEVTRLINMKKYRVEDFVTYSSCIAQVSLDVAKEFDASPISKFEEVLKVAFSQEEIRTLAHKYGFDIPARLKKEDLLQYVKDMMRAKRKLTLALQRELKDMTLVQLNNFCSLQNLGISSYLKKEELIHLLLFFFKQAKFPTIEANNILGMSFTDPIKFRVDLDVVDNFKRGIPKKVIYLEGEEELSIADLEEIEEVVEPAPKKRHTKNDMITEIVKKLLPYLNIDEETARLAIEHGLVPDNVVKKTTTKTTKPEQKKKTRTR